MKIDVGPAVDALDVLKPDGEAHVVAVGFYRFSLVSGQFPHSLNWLGFMSVSDSSAV
jgi:hypothetical protein